MRITVRVLDDLGETVKASTDNVSAYVTEALREAFPATRSESRQRRSTAS